MPSTSATIPVLLQPNVNPTLNPISESASTSEKIRWDQQIDRQIENFLSSPKLKNKVFKYSYDSRPWQFRIVHNPERQTLSSGGGGFQMKFTFGLMAKDPLPQELIEHLQDVIKQKLGISGGAYVSNGGMINGRLDFDA